jgi:transcription initiation factor IIF auxiliary subunit
LDAPEDVLAQIDSVRYELHPTFQPPYQIVRAREICFRLTRVGWGVFQVGVKVTFKDNTVGETVHQLTFETD